jgi:hypothetical protein
MNRILMVLLAWAGITAGSTIVFAQSIDLDDPGSLTFESVTEEGFPNFGTVEVPDDLLWVEELDATRINEFVNELAADKRLELVQHCAVLTQNRDRFDQMLWAFCDVVRAGLRAN